MTRRLQLRTVYFPRYQEALVLQKDNNKSTIHTISLINKIGIILSCTAWTAGCNVTI